MKKQMELEKIRLENIRERQEAQTRQENQYKSSSGNILYQDYIKTNQQIIEQNKKKQKKI